MWIQSTASHPISFRQTLVLYPIYTYVSQVSPSLQVSRLKSVCMSDAPHNSYMSRSFHSPVYDLHIRMTYGEKYNLWSSDFFFWRQVVCGTCTVPDAKVRGSYGGTRKTAPTNGTSPALPVMDSHCIRLLVGMNMTRRKLSMRHTPQRTNATFWKHWYCRRPLVDIFSINRFLLLYFAQLCAEIRTLAISYVFASDHIALKHFRHTLYFRILF
jgi:hypothetical protein